MTPEMLLSPTSSLLTSSLTFPDIDPTGAGVGEVLGSELSLGRVVGKSLGRILSLGRVVGTSLGRTLSLGRDEGAGDSAVGGARRIGADDGTPLGADEGESIGDGVGRPLGPLEGLSVGAGVGA